MNWDDVRYVLALSSAGTLVGAAKLLDSHHTTVARRIDAAEDSLGVRLFTRGATGYVATAEADRLLAPMRQVEAAALAVERLASAGRDDLVGQLRVTSPETFGVAYLAPRLAAFGQRHPGLAIEIVPAGEVLDLGRRQAEIAIRTFRSKQANLVLRRLATVGYGVYAAHAYLARRPLKGPADLAHHVVLAPRGARDIETAWLARLCPSARPGFTSDLSLALLAAARASAGVAILPRYLGDAEPSLRHVAMPDPPAETLWLTVHRDLKATPRVRALLDHLVATATADARLLRGS
jgi:DNA-binding transcriptional LysR family regulator